MQEFFNEFIHEIELPLKNPVLIFSIVLLIILLSPILLRKLNIPGIIGLIIAGVIIGPHGLNILAKNSAVELFSTIGLLYIMFIAGLELDLNEFKANRNKSLSFGFLTFIIPLSIGFPVCHYVLNYGLETSLLTASMFATHTLVAYPIVSKFGISKNQAVAVTVGGTILTDTAVLIILAVIIGSTNGNLNSEFWIKLGSSLAVFSIIIFFIIPKVAKWFFNTLESEKHSHYIFVLSVVFFAAFLAEIAGVEHIIGAFFAGLALNKLIPHSSALMNRIEFIGNSLFIPFFLISVGMIVNISVIMRGPEAIIIALTLTVVAITSKWLAAFITQKIYKYSQPQRQLIFGLSSAHAAATLAVILVGYNKGILDENILNGTIILILITCIVASFATEKAAKKIMIESDKDELDTADLTLQNPEHILIPLPDLKNFDKLLELSILVKDKKSSNPISILSVVANNNEAEANLLKTREKLENVVKHAAASETKVNILTTIDHNSTSGITRVSREILASIVVLKWPRQSSIIDKFLGEKTDSIIYSCNKTIFVCDIERPLVIHKKIVITVPPLSEFDNGFETWLLKVTLLSKELSAAIHFFANDNTIKAIQQTIENNKISNPIKYTEFTEWDDFLVLTRNISDDDLLILVSARKASASYMSLLDRLPSKLNKYFDKNNKVIIYPQEFFDVATQETFNEVSNEALDKGIETVQKIGKVIGSIFKSKDGDQNIDDLDKKE